MIEFTIVFLYSFARLIFLSNFLSFSVPVLSSIHTKATHSFSLLFLHSVCPVVCVCVKFSRPAFLIIYHRNCSCLLLIEIYVSLNFLFFFKLLRRSHVLSVLFLAFIGGMILFCLLVSILPMNRLSSI